MYKAKYQKYITKSVARFAEADEIKSATRPAFDSWQRCAGVPLYYEGDTLYVDNEDNHTLVVGPTGCKKTRVIVNSTLASIIESGESAVINDPKGELYRRTAERARSRGADVVLLNFRKPNASHGWNPLAQAKRFQQTGKNDLALQCINDFAETVVAPSLERTADTYWAESSKSFLVALMLMLLDSVPIEYFNIKTLLPFCYERAQSVLKQVVNKMDQTSTAVFGLRTVIDLSAEKTKSCIYSMLLSILRPFVQNKNLVDMLCCDDINIENIGKKQTLVYIVYPDEKDNLNFLVNLFVTQCYETLLGLAAESAANRLPVRVNFILDEFSNLTPISNFANRISEARSKNIRYFLLIQSYGQLKQKYKDCAETIISNCNNWICFGSKEMEFLDKVSKICGTEIDYNGREQALLSAHKMQYLQKEQKASEVLIIKQGHYPFVTKLPDFAYLAIADKYTEIEETAVEYNRRICCVTPDIWLSKVNDHSFRLPYPETFAA